MFDLQDFVSISLNKPTEIVKKIPMYDIDIKYKHVGNIYLHIYTPV